MDVAAAMAVAVTPSAIPSGLFGHVRLEVPETPKEGMLGTEVLMTHVYIHHPSHKARLLSRQMEAAVAKVTNILLMNLMRAKILFFNDGETGNSKTEAWTFDNSDGYLLIDIINITSIATSGGVLADRKSHCKFFQEHSASQCTLNEWKNKVRESNCTLIAGPTDPETTHFGGVGVIGCLCPRY